MPISTLLLSFAAQTFVILLFMALVLWLYGIKPRLNHRGLDLIDGDIPIRRLTKRLGVDIPQPGFDRKRRIIGYAAITFTIGILSFAALNTLITLL